MSHRFSNTILSVQSASMESLDAIQNSEPSYQSMPHLGVMQNMRPQLGNDVKSRLPDSVPVGSTLDFIILCSAGTRSSSVKSSLFWNFWIL